MNHRPHHSRESLRRLLATGCATLVFSLGLISASPALHAWVHGITAHDHHAHDATPSAPGERGCVVVWFAHGVALAVDTAVVTTAPWIWRDTPVLAADELLLGTPHYWHRPGRAPPVRLS